MHRYYLYALPLIVLTLLFGTAGCGCGAEQTALTANTQTQSTAATAVPQLKPTDPPADEVDEEAERADEAGEVVDVGSEGEETSLEACGCSNDAMVGALQLTLQQIHDEVAPSVVHIRVVQKQSREETLFPGVPQFPFSHPDLFPEPDMPNQPEEFFQEGFGSGFVWDKEGHIVSNYHVVQDAEDITVTFSDGTMEDATLIGHDQDSDLAVLKVDLPADALTPIKVKSSDGVKVGQLAVVMGNPFGLEGTMTVGFVSARGRSLPVDTQAVGPTYSIPDIIQTDAALNPGNSGGAMVNDKGELIGVPTAIRSPVRASAGVGFAIPSAIVEQVVPSLVEDGSYEHSWLGISGRSMTPDLAEAMELDPNQRGALVIEVVNDGPADKAGVQGSGHEVTIEGIPMRVGGDMVVGIDDEPVHEFYDIIAYLARSTTVGQEITLTVLRDGEEQELTVTLGSRPTQDGTEPVAQAETPESEQAWLGIQGMTVIPDIAEEMDLPSDQEGILVVGVEAESPADNAGLRGSYKNITIDGEQVVIGGDIITAVDGEAVSDEEALQAIIDSAAPGDTITLTILRDGEEQEREVTLEEQP